MRSKFNILFFIFLTGLGISTCYAQNGDLYNHGLITILDGAEVTISGNYVHTNDTFQAPPEILNAGNIRVAGDIINQSDLNGIFPTDSGIVTLIGGNTQQIICPDSNIRFYKFILDKTAGTEAQIIDSIRIGDTLHFGSGLINLVSGNINLADGVVLNNESETSRIYGIGGLITSRIGVNNAGFTHAGNLGLELKGSMGMTYVERGHIIRNVSDGSIVRYFNAIPNFSTDTFQVLFHYFDAELNGNTEADLDLYRSFNQVAWRGQNGSIDVGNNIVTNSFEGETIDTNLNVYTLAPGECTTLPPVDLGLDSLYLCTDDTLTLDMGIAGLAEYIWSNGDSAQTTRASASGWYYATGIDLRGCLAIDSVLLIDKSVPVASFSAPVITCLTDSSAFTDLSTIGTGSITGHHWDFGTGLPEDTSVVGSPFFTYSQYGDFSVTLTVTSDFGCTDDSTIINPVKPLPEPEFAFNNNVCFGTAVDFSDSTIIADPPSVTFMYNWDFGDGSNSNAQNPSHTYASAGTYTVKLISTYGNTGCKDSINKTVDVQSFPIASYTVNAGCAYDTTIFTNTSTDNTLNYWELGDGTLANSQDTSHLYASAGVYTTKLVVENNYGCKDSLSQLIQIDTVPIVNYNMNESCQLATITFNDLSTDTDAGAAYAWIFGDGNTSNIATAQNTYLTAGPYNVQLSVTNSNGCLATKDTSIVIYPKPVAGFVKANVCDGITANLTNTSSIISGNLNYSWNLGDGTIITSENVGHDYATDGKYGIQLIASSGFGCTDTITDSITIHPLPLVNLGGTIITCGSSYLFDAGNAGSAFVWSDFSTNQTFNVGTDGNYSVTITSPDGCVASDLASVTLNTMPVTNLGNDTTVCDGLTLSVPLQMGSSYLWSTGGIQNTIDVSTSGMYWVQVTDQNACISRDTINVVVNPLPVVNLGIDITTCAGQPVLLDAGNAGASFTWSTAAGSQTITPITSDLYWVEVTNGLGCSYRDSIQVLFNPLPIIGFQDTTFSCGNAMLDAGNAGSMFTWNTGGSGQTILVSTDGSYDVVVTDGNGCTNNDTTYVQILNVPFESIDNILLCNGADTTITIAQAGNYLWSNGSSNAFNTFAGTGIYWVDIFNSAGCSLRDSFEINADNSLNAELGEDQVLCNLNTIELSGGNADSYAWYLNDTLIGTDSTLLISGGGSYQLIVTSAAGCIKTDDIVFIETTESIDAQFLEPSIVNIGDTAFFVQVSTPFDGLSYSWNFGDGTSSDEENPWHIYYVPNTYNVTFIAYNEYCADTITKPIEIVPLQQENLDSLIGSQNHRLIQDVKLYPNPVQDLFTLEIDLFEEQDVKITTYNMYGQPVFQNHYVVDFLKEDYQISKLSAGVYFLEVSAGKEKSLMRFVKF